MSFVNEDDFKSMWVKRYGHEPVYYSEKYKYKGKNVDNEAEQELQHMVEIGGVYFKVEE